MSRGWAFFRHTTSIFWKSARWGACGWHCLFSYRSFPLASLLSLRLPPNHHHAWMQCFIWEQPAACLDTQKVTSIAQLSLLFCSAVAFLKWKPGKALGTQRALPTITFFHLKWAHCPHLWDHRFQRRHMKSFPRTWNHICALDSQVRLLWAHLGFQFYFFVSTVTERMWECTPVGHTAQLVPWWHKSHSERCTLMGQSKALGAPGFRQPAWDIFFLKRLV